MNIKGITAGVASALALAVTLSACAPDAQPGPATNAASKVTIVDSQERKVELATNPEVVIATDWSVVRTLNDLGIEVDAVPTPNGGLPADLAKYADAKFPKIGTLFELDYEAINELEPDLVIVGSRSGTPEVVNELVKITPNVIDMSVRFEQAADQLPKTKERVTQLASIFDKSAEAEKQFTEIEKSIADSKAAATKAGLTAMFVQVSGGKAGAYGPNSRFGIVFQEFGFADTAAPVNDEGSHGEEVGQEFFAKYNPGTILVLDRAKTIGEKEQGALKVLDNGLVNTTDAAKNRKIAEVDGFSWYLATAAPSSLRQMVTDVNQVLNP